MSPQELINGGFFVVDEESVAMAKNRIVIEKKFQWALQQFAAKSKKVLVVVPCCVKHVPDFSPEHSRSAKVRLIEDMPEEAVRRGFMNPSGVGTLCQLREMKTFQGLHFKVVGFDSDAAIVGSVNFSRSSDDSQGQCCILTKDASAIKNPRQWFYSWQDLELGHDFHEVETLPENDRIRYTISPAARKELLKRLLALNHQLYAEEEAQGLHNKTTTKKSKSAKADNDNQKELKLDL